MDKKSEKKYPARMKTGRRGRNLAKKLAAEKNNSSEVEAVVAEKKPAKKATPKKPALKKAETKKTAPKKTEAKKETKAPAKKETPREEAPKVVEQPKKKGGRPPMSEEAKAAAAKARKEQKEKEELAKISTAYVQFAGTEAATDELVDRAKAAFKSEHKRTAIEQLKIYIKPEDRAAYYVVNDRFAGKVDF